MFEHIDLSILDNPEFKEDSVREEIILPILFRLGYSATGRHQITRSRALSHPFVMIGSRRHPVNIFPDYLLKVGGVYGFVLDAKSPSEPIYRSTNVEQVYSYAIHPDVRVNIYALCNGREFAVYGISEIEPLIRFQIAEIEANWAELEAILSPEVLLEPLKKDFIPDFGILATKAGYKPDLNWHLAGNAISNIIKVNESLYTACGEINSGMDGEETPHLVSLDFSPAIFEDLLAFAPEPAQLEIRSMLSHHPYQANLSTPLEVHLEAHLGELQTGVYEQFVPMIVTKVRSPDYSEP